MTISTMPPKPVTVGGIHKFLFWCQTALPAVYGDELSYMEVLCKVKNVLNEVIEELNVHGEDINVLIELYQQILDMLDYSRKHGYLIKSTTATAINAELAQHASEKPIMFYPLPYSLDAPIIVPCGAYIDFNGATLNRIGGAHDVVVLESCLEKTVLMNAVIDGRMKEDGFDPELPVNRFSGIALRKCSGVHLENMSVTNTCNGEIQPEGTNGGLLIDTCDGIRVTGGDFSKNDRSGIVAVDSSNVTVERATGDDNGGSFFTSARCSNLKVDGCKAVGNGYTGISLNGTNLHVARVLPAADEAVRLRRLSGVVVEAWARHVRVARDPSHAVRLHAALVESPGVGVDPRPDAGLIMHDAHELVDPVNALIALPVQHRNAFAEVVARVVYEMDGLFHGIVGLREMVESPGLSVSAAPLHPAVAAPVHETHALGRLADHEVHVGKHRIRVQPGLPVGYVDAPKHS